MSAELIERTLRELAPADEAAAAAARAALDAKAKPRRSLGRLEELAVRIVAIRGVVPSEPLRPAVVVCAADHGIAEEGVSAYPQEVTRQMLGAFGEGHAAINVLAREADARVIVVDVGVREPLPHPRILDRAVRRGTANAALGPAMSVAQAELAIATGIALAYELIADGVSLIALGDMGIGNTTAAAALTAALLDVDPASVCGRGTGLDEGGVSHKVATVRRALAANRVDPADPLATLAAVGGLEIAALAGVVLGAVARRTPVLVDGFITGAATLVAWRMDPGAADAALAPQRRRSAIADALVASHRSPEPGHSVILDALGLEPLLDLGLRLGEGSGAALALPLVRAALAILSDMATFDGAGVTDAGA